LFFFFLFPSFWSLCRAGAGTEPAPTGDADHRTNVHRGTTGFRL